MHVLACVADMCACLVCVADMCACFRCGRNVYVCLHVEMCVCFNIW